MDVWAKDFVGAGCSVGLAENWCGSLYRGDGFLGE